MTTQYCNQCHGVNPEYPTSPSQSECTCSSNLPQLLADIRKAAVGVGYIDALNDVMTLFIHNRTMTVEEIVTKLRQIIITGGN